jgi:hypothetical protein
VKLERCYAPDLRITERIEFLQATQSISRQICSVSVTHPKYDAIAKDHVEVSMEGRTHFLDSVQIDDRRAMDSSKSRRIKLSLEPHLAAGMLSREYIQRASAAMGRAAPRLYSPLVPPMAPWVTAGITALFWIVSTNLFQWTPNEKVVTLMAITGVSWFAV